MTDNLLQSKINAAVDALNSGKPDFASLPPVANTARALINDRGEIILNASSAATLAAILAETNISGLPTSDPGGGKLWLNGGVLQVGAA